MQEVILVPLDGSAPAEAVLPHALALAQGTASALTLIRVIPPPTMLERIDWTAALSGLSASTLPDEAVAAPVYLAGLAARLRGAGVTVRTEVLEGDPARLIADRAGRYRNTRLLIMGARARRGSRRWMLGSVAEAVLRDSPIPLLLVRGTADAPAGLTAAVYRTLIVPLDGSALAEQALAYAAELALTIHAGLVLLTAVEEPPAAGSMAAAGTSTMPPGRRAARVATIQAASAYLDGLANELRANKLPVRTEVVCGAAAGAILQASAEQPASLIVLTTHGRSGFRYGRLGSVTTAVLAAAQAPVLVVRAHVYPRSHGRTTPGRRVLRTVAH